MLHRAAAATGATMNYRVVASTFDAALRVVAAGLGIGVIPRQVTRGLNKQQGIKVIPLTDAWAQRRFAVCFHGWTELTPAALRMVEYLAARSQTSSVRDEGTASTQDLGSAHQG